MTALQQLQMGTNEERLRMAARLSPAVWAYVASEGRWQMAKHLRLLTDSLMDVISGSCKRLLVQMPPRHGKSEYISKYFPSYLVGTNPEHRVVLCAYEHDFATRWGIKARALLQRYGKDMFGVQIDPDVSKADDWGITGHDGGMMCAGVGGPITGKGGNTLIIDDPVKNEEQANSQVYRDRAWDWYRSTFYTRAEPDAAIIVVQTRWHEDDLAGRIITQPETGEVWRQINLPALAEEGDPLGRTPGEALWPLRYPVKRLEVIRAAVGPYWWDALYQGRPSPPEGTIFKKQWWRYYTDLPEKVDRWIISVDCAFKDTKSSDFVVAQVWCRSGANLFLVDQRRARMDFVATCAAIESLARKYPQAGPKLIEDSANGPAVITAMHHRIRGLIPIPVRLIGRGDNSKVARAQSILYMVESGNVYLPDPQLSPWVSEFVHETASFPRGAHNDQVDAMTQALSRYHGSKDIEEEAEEILPPMAATIKRKIESMQRSGSDDYMDDDDLWTS